jgi:hypothetical protein
MIYPILGEYKNNKFKINILSKKNYNICLQIYKNEEIQYTKDIYIKSYIVNNIIIENIELGYKYKLIFNENDNKDNNKIDELDINLLDNPFDNVKVVCCDSNIGLETNTWDKMNKKFGVIFHIGDFIYNDIIFYINYYKSLNTQKIDKNSIYKEIYDNYIECIIRKLYYLKNNFNYVMTDDHESVDGPFYNQNKDNIIFIKIFKIFKKLEIEILHTLQFNKETFDYIKDNKNNTLYVMNNNNLLMDDKIIKKYLIYKKIKKYKNIIFLERKICLSINTDTLTKIIYDNDKNLKINNDNLYNMINKFNINGNKNIYVLSGDIHLIASLDVYKDDNKICAIKCIGSINSCVIIGYVNLFLSSSNYHLKNKEIIKKNGFININYKNNNLIIKEIINDKTNIIFNTINTVYSGLKFLYYRNILKYL